MSRLRRARASAERGGGDRYGHGVSLIEALTSRVGVDLRGNGSPFWHEGRNNTPAESAQEARRKRRNLVKLLLRSQDDLGEHCDLVNRLRACSLTKPCCSGACPVCRRALRRLLVHASRNIFGGNRFAFVTCICDEDCVLCNSALEIETIATAERRIMDVAVATTTRILGAVDVSANEHERGIFPPHYQVHVHFLALGGVFARQRVELDRSYCSAPIIGRPIVAKCFDGRQRGIAYIFDAPTDRRISRDPRMRPDGTWRAAPKYRPLNSRQRIAMARLLDRAGIEACILLYGYELRTDGDDVWLATVSRRNADEMLATRRRQAAQRLREQTDRDRQRTRVLRARERCRPTLWPDRM